MAIRFEFQFKKAKASLLYLMDGNLPEFTKGKACKLLFLSDKRHLVQHGRPITGDSYAAMEHGPIPSRMLDILDDVEAGNPSSAEAVEMANAVSMDRRFRYPRLVPIEKPQTQHLSESDIDVLNQVIRWYGRKSFSSLRQLTHDVPAYEKVWNAPERAAGSVPMKFEDFFEEDENALAGVLEEAVENAVLKEIFPEPAWL